MADVASEERTNLRVSEATREAVKELQAQLRLSSQEATVRELLRAYTGHPHRQRLSDPEAIRSLAPPLEDNEE